MAVQSASEVAMEDQALAEQSLSKVVRAHPLQVAPYRSQVDRKLQQVAILARFPCPLGRHRQVQAALSLCRQGQQRVERVERSPFQSEMALQLLVAA